MTTIDVSLPVIWQAEAQQQIYRSLLTAFSYPGRIQQLAIDALEWDAVAASLATMVDGQVTYYLEEGLQSDDFVRFMAGRSTTAEAADWLAFDGRKAVPAIQPKLGTLEEPELSATLLLKVDNLGAVSGTELTLEGPGINGRQRVTISGLDDSWLAARAQWCHKFPQGIDLIFCADSQLFVLPRTSKIIEE